MNIAINCVFCQPKGGGIKEYIYNLVSGISSIDHSNRYIIYVLQDCVDYASQLLPLSPNMKMKAIPYGSSYIDVVKRSLFSNSFWQREEELEQIDLFHSPFFHCPKLRRAKILLTVHDLRLYRYPETYAFWRYQFLSRSVRKSIRNADHIISISEFTKNEIIDTCGISEDKISVVLEAINREDFSEEKIADFVPDNSLRELIDNPFILTVGHVEPRKNYERLILSFQNLKKNKNAQGYKLVIVGKKNVDFEKTIRAIDQDPDIMYLDFVPRELLLWLYKNAALFVFPSIYEGFGFPPLEAACLGTISAVSRISSIPEVCGDSVDYFDPYNIGDITRSLERCLFDSAIREGYKSKLEYNLSRFSWEKNTIETIDIYNKMS